MWLTWYTPNEQVKRIILPNAKIHFCHLSNWFMLIYLMLIRFFYYQFLLQFEENAKFKDLSAMFLPQISTLFFKTNVFRIQVLFLSQSPTLSGWSNQDTSRLEFFRASYHGFGQPKPRLEIYSLDLKPRAWSNVGLRESVLTIRSFDFRNLPVKKTKFLLV